MAWDYIRIAKLESAKEGGAFTRGERAENWGLGTGRSQLEKMAAGLG